MTFRVVSWRGGCQLLLDARVNPRLGTRMDVVVKAVAIGKAYCGGWFLEQRVWLPCCVVSHLGLETVHDINKDAHLRGTDVRSPEPVLNRKPGWLVRFVIEHSSALAFHSSEVKGRSSMMVRLLAENK